MDSVHREQESIGGLRRARVDRTIFDDDRVLANLLRNEQKYMPSSHYFKTLQPDLKPFMRKMVTEWMLEVRFRARLGVSRGLLNRSAWGFEDPRDFEDLLLFGDRIF